MTIGFLGCAMMALDVGLDDNFLTKPSTDSMNDHESAEMKANSETSEGMTCEKVKTSENGMAFEEGIKVGDFLNTRKKIKGD